MALTMADVLKLEFARVAGVQWRRAETLEGEIKSAPTAAVRAGKIRAWQKLTRLSWDGKGVKGE